MSDLPKRMDRETFEELCPFYIVMPGTAYEEIDGQQVPFPILANGIMDPECGGLHVQEWYPFCPN